MSRYDNGHNTSYRLYLKELAGMADALRELGDRWSAKFVDSLYRQISRQGPDNWMTSAKQMEVMKKIREQHGDLLTNDAKRKNLLKRRQEFMVRFSRLQEAAKEDPRLSAILSSIASQIDRGRSLSDKQKAVIQRGFRTYRIAHVYERS